MTSPRRTASQLRRIAAGIEASSNPSRELVARDIKRVVASLRVSVPGNVKVDESASKREEWGGFDAYAIVEKEDGVYRVRVHDDFGDGKEGTAYYIEKDGEEVHREVLPQQSDSELPGELLKYESDFERDTRQFFTPEEIKGIIRALNAWHEKGNPWVLTPERVKAWQRGPEAEPGIFYYEMLNPRGSNYEVIMKPVSDREVMLTKSACKEMREVINRWYVSKGLPLGKYDPFNLVIPIWSNSTGRVRYPLNLDPSLPGLSKEDTQELLSVINKWYKSSGHKLVDYEAFDQDPWEY